MMLSSSLIETFKELAGHGGWLTEAADTERYQQDFRRLYRGNSPLVLKPLTVQAVISIVSLANQQKIAIVPQGGNTSYCGGATPREGQDEIVLSLERLKKIREIDRSGNTITVDAGCTLAEVQIAARTAQRLLAVSLGSEASCQIGGNLSTNAGGTSVLRYGMMRDQVLGLEVVLPNGSFLNQLRGLRKDNTGYDVKQLFLGAEGTLGVITGACLKLFPEPISQLTALIGIQDLASAVTLLSCLRDAFGDTVTGFEYMPQPAIAMALRHVANLKLGMTATHPAYALVELDAPITESAAERLDKCLAALPGVLDSAVAFSDEQRTGMWNLRESIPEGQRREGASLKHDISLPIASLARFVDEASQHLALLAPGAQLIAYGHVGDGNLHFNLSPAPGADGSALLALADPVKRCVHDLVAAYGGSFSAEHGIGRLKVDELQRYEDPVALALMHQIKALLDPNNIMNPGKVLRR